MKYKSLLVTLCSAFLFLGCINITHAQEKKVAPTSQELYNEIAAMDTVLFDAFNAKEMEKFKPIFYEDL
jgi:PBP1b-binding outer membrane lipoprotein LpoB